MTSDLEKLAAKELKATRRRCLLLAILWALVGIVQVAVGILGIKRAWSYDYVDRRGYRHWNHLHHAPHKVRVLVRPGNRRGEPPRIAYVWPPALVDWSTGGHAVAPVCCEVPWKK